MRDVTFVWKFLKGFWNTISQCKNVIEVVNGNLMLAKHFRLQRKRISCCTGNQRSSKEFTMEAFTQLNRQLESFNKKKFCNEI